MDTIKNTSRFDPYKNFKFRVMIDGKPVAGVTKITLPSVKRSVPENVAPKNKKDNAPGSIKFEPVTLERGVTHDPEFANWAKTTVMKRSGSDLKSKNIRKDVTIELYGESGKLAASYKLTNAWISKFESTDLNSTANEVAIETIELQHEGIELIQ
jgi:phage tail-like protein